MQKNNKEQINGLMTELQEIKELVKELKQTSNDFLIKNLDNVTFSDKENRVLFKNMLACVECLNEMIVEKCVL